MTKAVLVTTKHRGVFFGYVKADDKFPAAMTLTGVRNCMYWERIGGFLGLAATGPTKGCRIGARVPELTLCDITSVAPLEDAAVQAWEAAPTYGAAA